VHHINEASGDHTGGFFLLFFCSAALRPAGDYLAAPEFPDVLR
jgi:hypothetical protein